MRKRFKKSRVPKTLKKIERVTKTELDRTFHAQLAEVKRLRDDELAEAGESYRVAIMAARDAHTAARGETWQRYDERRDTILKNLAPEAQAA